MEIDLGPLCLSEFPKPDKQYGRHLQRCLDDDRAPVGMQRAQQVPQLNRVDHGGMVALRGRGQGPAQVGDGVSLATSGGERIPHALAAVLHDPVRRLDRAPGFDGSRSP